MVDECPTRCYLLYSVFNFCFALLCNELQPIDDIDVIVFIMERFAGIAPHPPTKESDLRLAAWIALASIGSILVAYIWCIKYAIYLIFKGVWINRFSESVLTVKYWRKAFDAGKISLIKKIVSDDRFDALLVDSWVTQRPVRITLYSRKIYVCRICDLSTPNECNGVSTQHIAIAPMYGGYKDEKKLTICPTTYESSYEGIRIKVIKKDEIISMSAAYEDCDLAEKWNDNPEVETENGGESKLRFKLKPRTRFRSRLRVD